MTKWVEQWVGRLLLLIAISTVIEPINAVEIKRFEPMDVFDLEYANYPQVSPDGSQVLYLRRSFDVMRDASRASLWLVDLKTDQHAPLIADC